MSYEGNQEYQNNYDYNTTYNISDKNSYYSCREGSDERSKSRERSRKRSRRDRSYSSSRSRSPQSYKRTRYYGSRENPDKSRVLGVFGLHASTIEDDLVNVFSYYGPIEEVRIVYDAKTGKSRGFAFIYFDYIDDASEARRKCNGMKLNGKRIRVDYSITKRPHTPTPGVYMGNRNERQSKYRNHSSSRRRHRRRSSSYSRRSRSSSR